MDRIISRRNMLKGVAGAGGALALTSFSQLFGVSSAHAQDSQDSVETIVSLAATAETLATTAYYATIAYGKSLGYSDENIEYFKLALDAELYHFDFLTSAGGKQLAQEFYVPAAFLTDKTTNVQTIIAAETAFVGAYLAATRRFAELGQPRLAATTAQHAVSEGEHLLLARDAAGATPNPNALPAAIYYNVSDALSTLAPFLNGGEGFIGPVKWPGSDAIIAAIGETRAQRLPTFLSVF